MSDVSAKVRRGVFPLCLCLCFTAAAWGGPVEPPSQEVLALELQFELSRAPADDAAAREALYRRLIDECPQTAAA
jgi:hypothetical protein